MNNWQKQLESVGKYSALAVGFSIPLSTSFTSIFFILTIVLVIASGQWREKWQLIKTNPVAIAAVALFLLLVIGCFYSIAPLSDCLVELRKFHPLLFLPLILPVFAEEKWRCLGLCVFMVALSIQLIGGTYVNLFVLSSLSTISHDHISIGIMMAFVCFVYFHLAILERGKLRYLFTGLFLITSVYLLFINTGRTAFILFFVLLVCSLVQILRWRGLWISLLLSALLMAGAFYFSPTFHNQGMAAVENAVDYERLTASDHTKVTGDTEPTSGGLRLQWMHDSMIIFKAYPIIGAGTGAYLTATKLLLPNYDARYFTDKPHNDVFTIMAQLGVLGLMGLVALYAFHGYLSLSLSSPYNRFAQLLLLTMLVGGLFNSLLRDGTTLDFFVYMTALCMAQYKSPNNRLKNKQS